MTGRGVVAAGHPESAAAGAAVLRAGGNAVDAAVAAVLTSFVAEPLLTGLGSGGYLLVAPPGDAPVHGLTSAVMAATVRFCFDRLGATRVVVEPDVTNTRIAAKNAAAGFRVLRELELPGKRAHLAVCTRADFDASPLGRSAA